MILGRRQSDLRLLRWYYSQLRSFCLSIGITFMRLILAIVLLVVIAFFLGWLKFSSDDSGATIRVDGSEVREDTEAIVDGTKDLINKGAEKVSDADDTTQERTDQNARRTITP